MERAWPGWNWEAGEWGGTQLQVVAGAGEGCCRPCGEFLFQAGSSGGPLPGPRLILEEPLPLWAEWARQRRGARGQAATVQVLRAAWSQGLLDLAGWFTCTLEGLPPSLSLWVPGAEAQACKPTPPGGTPALGLGASGEQSLRVRSELPA